MIRIPGAKLIPINYNPYSGSSACALVIDDVPTLRELSKHTGGSAEAATPINADFVKLAEMVEGAFEASSYRNKDDPRRLEPYQKLGVAFALGKKGRAGLFDPMGLGKTLQAVALAVACPTQYLPLVVVCPRNAIGAWQEQLGAVHNEPEKAWVKPGALRVHVVDNQKALVEAAKQIKRGRSRDEAYIIWNHMLTAPVNAKNVLPRDEAVQDIASALAVRGLLVFDEAHYFRVPTSEMFRRGYMMARTAAHVLALTGTPALSSVTQTLPILALIDPNSSVIPALQDFPLVVSKGARTEAQEEAAEEAAMRAAESASGAPGQAAMPDPWGALQRKFIEHYAGEGGVGEVKEMKTLKEFSPDYTDAYAKAVEDDFRQMVARRSRADAVTKTVDPPLKVGVAKKDRALLLVPVPEGLQLSRKSDAPFRFYQRAGLLAQIDGLVLQAVQRQNITPAQDEALQLQMVEKSPAIQKLLTEFKCATTTLKSGVGDASARMMGKVVAPEAASRFGKQNHRPTVYFVDNVDTANDLAGRLWNLYHNVPNFQLYLYSGSMAGQVTNSVVVNQGKTDATTKYSVVVENTAKKNFLSDVVAKAFEPRYWKEPRILVSTQAGREGVNLPAGAEVIFVQRFGSPGLEEQAEDRINRASRLPEAPRPQVLYYMPDHYNSFVLLNRLERRRAAALKTYGETPSSDFSTPLKFEYEDDTGNPKSDYLRRSFAAESDVTNNFRNYLRGRIRWALKKQQELPKAGFDRLVASMSGNGSALYIYNNLMGLIVNYKYEQWCEDLARPPGSSGPSGPRPPPEDQTGDPVQTASDSSAIPDDYIDIGRITYFADQEGTWGEIDKNNITKDLNANDYYYLYWPDLDRGVYGVIVPNSKVYGADPRYKYHVPVDENGELQRGTPRPLKDLHFASKIYKWTPKRPNPRRRSSWWPF